MGYGVAVDQTTGKAEEKALEAISNETDGNVVNGQEDNE